MSLDSLLNVTAYFYDAGDDFDYLNEVDDGRFCSFGHLETDTEDEYISGIPSDEEVEKWNKAQKDEHERSRGLFCNFIEGPKAKVIKDFVMFEIDVIGLHPQSCIHGTGISHDIEALGEYDAFDGLQDTLVGYAKEVRAEVIKGQEDQWEQKNKWKKPEYRSEKKFEKIDRVNFLLVGEYDCYRCSYEYEEYDCEIDIAGRVTKQDFNEMLDMREHEDKGDLSELE